jgi:hypothetical protein
MFAELWLFIRSFWGRWFIAMSGSPSVPLAIIAYFVEQTAAKVALAITAIACVFLAAFLSWREEHRKWGEEKTKVAALNAKLSPKIEISLYGNGVAEDIDQHGLYTKRVQFVVRGMTKAALVACQAQMERVDRLSATMHTITPLMDESLRSEWSNRDEIERFGNITIPEGMSQRVHLFCITKESGPLFPILQNYKKGLVDGIAEPGKYRVSVAVSATDAKTAKETFILEWLDYENISLTLTRQV